MVSQLCHHSRSLICYPTSAKRLLQPPTSKDPTLKKLDKFNKSSANQPLIMEQRPQPEKKAGILFLQTEAEDVK